MADDLDDLKRSFDEVAALYDAVRPDYPAALIDEVVSLSGIPAGGRILEIGTGSGKATVLFARRGYRLLGLELGEQLAAIARDKTAAFPEIRIETTAFEDWNDEPGAFDLVLSAQAFHWIAPEVGYPKAARALRPGGSLALFWNMHTFPLTGFFEESQAIYERLVPELTSSWRVKKTRYPEIVEVRRSEIEASGCFENVEVREFPWEASYSREEHVRLISTYSDHNALAPQVKDRLFDALGDLIDDRYGGRITKPYVAVLFLATLPQ